MISLTEAIKNNLLNEAKKDDKYWQMIDSVRDGDGDFDEKMIKLRRKLGKKDYEEFCDWCGDRAWEIQDAYEEEDMEGLSDDGLEYASWGAVLAGKDSFKYAKKSPGVISDYESDGEQFLYSTSAPQDAEDDGEEFQDEPEVDNEEPKKDAEGNILKDEEVEDPETGKKIKVTTHTGPRGGKFYWPDGVPKDNEHKVYIKKGK